MKFVGKIHLIVLMLGVLAQPAFAEEEGEAEVSPKAQYVELKPPFVTNFGSSSKKLKYVKAEITLRVPSSAAADMIEAHKALVRHEIVMLLSSQPESVVVGAGGQETIRKAALEAIQEVIAEETGASQVDDLLFTSFVVQR